MTAFLMQIGFALRPGTIQLTAVAAGAGWNVGAYTDAAAVTVDGVAVGFDIYPDGRIWLFQRGDETVHGQPIAASTLIDRAAAYLRNAGVEPDGSPTVGPDLTGAGTWTVTWGRTIDGFIVDADPYMVDRGDTTDVELFADGALAGLRWVEHDHRPPPATRISSAAASALLRQQLDRTLHSTAAQHVVRSSPTLAWVLPDPLPSEDAAAPRLLQLTWSASKAVDLHTATTVWIDAGTGQVVAVTSGAD